MSMLVRLYRLAGSVYYYFLVYPVYKMLFRHIGRKTRILKPLKIEGHERITLGDRVVIGKYSWLASMPHTGTSSTLEIGDGCQVGNFNHIYATQQVVLGKKVLTADKVYISDNLHRFDQPGVAVLDQPIRQLKPVSIGEGSWIGENVCIFGASVGRHCVIGANSIVNKDIPDHSVAVGAPAKVIKRFDSETQAWRPVDVRGNFTDKTTAS